MTSDPCSDPRQVLAGLMTVIADHEQHDVRGWCLACLAGGVHNRHPCEILRRYEKAAERLRSFLARTSG